MIVPLIIITLVVALLLYGGNTVLIKRKPLEFPKFNFFNFDTDESVLKKPMPLLENDKHAPKPFDLVCTLRDDAYDYDGVLKKAGSEILCHDCNKYYYKTLDDHCIPFGYDKQYNEIGCGGTLEVRESCNAEAPEMGVCTIGNINEETGNWEIDPEPKSCPKKKFTLL